MAANRGTFETRPHRAAFKSWRRMGICATLITAALGGSLLACKQEPDVERGTRSLKIAVAKRRLIEPRVSGGFECGEYDSSNNRAGINEKELDRARKSITKVAGRGDPSGDLAYGRLLLSRNESLDEASKYLRHVLAEQPENAEAHNDFGVCLFQQGEFEKAIDKFEAALERKPDMPEALFNRALCYQRLLLRSAASDEFARLAEIETNEGWRREIQQRQQTLSAPLVTKIEEEIVNAFREAVASGDLDAARKIQNENCEVIVKQATLKCPAAYLSEWTAGNRHKAESELHLMEIIGQGLAEKKSDTSVIDLAKHLRGLSEEDRERELKLVQEYRALANFNMDQLNEARSISEKLAREFGDRGNDYFQYSSLFWDSNTYYSEGDFTKCIELLRQAQSIVERHQWPFARATLLLQIAAAQSRISMDDAAMECCNDVLSSAADLPFTRAKALQLRSKVHGNLGDREGRLLSLRESTEIFLDNVTSIKEIASNYLSLAECYRTRGDDRLALLCAEAAVAFSQADPKKPDNRRAAEAAAFAAVQCARLKQFDQAKDLRNRSSEYVKLVRKDQAYPKQYVLACAAQIAEICGEPAEAIKLYTNAVSALNGIKGEKLSLITNLEARAELYARNRAPKKARSDLLRAIREIERYREGINKGGSRTNFFDARQSVFDQMIALEARAGNYKKAFDFSEQSRARTLLDEFKGRQRSSLTDKQLTPLKLEQVAKALPDDVRLLNFSVTSIGTFLFLVTSAGIEDVKESPATTEQLDQLVNDYGSSIRGQAPLTEVNDKARTLYDLLIAPVEARIREGGKTLCIAPDKALNFLPFAALVDSDHNYLFKTCPLTYTPSASALALCAEESRAKGSYKADEAILAVGNPTFNREQFDLKDLQDADNEARESARLYPSADSKLLVRREATEDRVKAAFETCDVAHLAAHCLVRDPRVAVEGKSPWHAALLLADRRFEDQAGQSQDDGLLFLDEVYRMNLPRTRLVVLSACQSALGQYYRGEGIVSLIRPFLVVRVPMVVASLWSVDSQATAELMINFHRERKSCGGRAGDALRAAQMRMASSDSPKKHPYFWAPFIAVGSNN